ncbi:MAG TPA: hypothetical protein VL330_14180 [Actinomycetes bacterium]|nr:hypothetical protein [Actinomycetes bacterium]
MRTALRRAILTVTVAAVLAVGPAAWAQVETFGFTIDAARLATDRHTLVVSGTYTCGPLDLNVVAGGGTVDLTVRQGRVTGFGYVPIEVCDGTAQDWREEVTTFGGPTFKRGAARASASGDVRGERDGLPVTQRASVTNQRITITRR